jgi:Tfp pilus assembly pilus retraction ATPase PilT
MSFQRALPPWLTQAVEEAGDATVILKPGDRPFVIRSKAPYHLGTMPMTSLTLEGLAQQILSDDAQQALSKGQSVEETLGGNQLSVSVNAVRLDHDIVIKLRNATQKPADVDEVAEQLEHETQIIKASAAAALLAAAAPPNQPATAPPSTADTTPPPRPTFVVENAGGESVADIDLPVEEKEVDTLIARLSPVAAPAASDSDTIPADEPQQSATRTSAFARLGKFFSLRDQEENARREQEEAARRGQEDVERRASEDAVRREQEEAQRRAREDAVRGEQEEAARRASEDAARREQDAAARRAVEAAALRERADDERRAFEDGERRKQEDAARLALEEAERSEREDAARHAIEETALREREDAIRRARDEAARLEQQRAARRAADEVALREREEAARRALDEAARHEREEAARRADEDAAVRERESERENAAREELEHIARRIKEEAVRSAAKDTARQRGHRTEHRDGSIGVGPPAGRATVVELSRRGPLAVATTDLTDWIMEATNHGATALYLRAGSAPFARIDGQVEMLAVEPIPIAMFERAGAMLSAGDDGWSPAGDWAWSKHIPGTGRVHCQAFSDAQGGGFIIQLPVSIAALDDQVPRHIRNACETGEGLIVISAPFAEDVTAMVGAVVAWRAQRRAGHVISFGTHGSLERVAGNAFVSERPLSADDHDMAMALQTTTRERPDMVVVVADGPLAAVPALLSAAVGRLVIVGVVARTAPRAVEMLLNDVGPNRQLLSASLKAACSWRGFRTVGERRLVISDTLVATDRVRALIEAGDVAGLHLAQTSRQDGLRSVDAALAAAVGRRKITLREAAACAVDRKSLISLVRRQAQQRRAAARGAHDAVQRASDRRAINGA